jgi:hypothetical protein
MGQTPPNTACTPYSLHSSEQCGPTLGRAPLVPAPSAGKDRLVGVGAFSPLPAHGASKQFAWLEVGSVKVASPRPAHQRVTHTVGRS